MKKFDENNWHFQLLYFRNDKTFLEGLKTMRKCKFEDLIDNYLLNRLDEDKKKKFEEHYFNCSCCFEKIVERDELISIVKHKGDMIFQDQLAVEETKGVTWIDKIVSHLTPKQWAATAVSACLFLIICCLFLYVIPNRRPTLPPGSIEDESIVRGTQIKIKVIPAKIEWSELGEDVEYKIYIYDKSDKLWSSTTKENFIVLPEEVKRRMILGKIYSCEVKAFSPQGALKASGKTEFKIQKTK